ncbi:T9SS type A sorting domain-containing protein, partial [Bacteroidales bacterium OttesenSCG-928-L03]|nr:T9SS type A sorting domain-containing protein [Bacteroidales bacterium OttesenSCG-928-L03]
IQDDRILLKSFLNRDIKIEAKAIPGYDFKQWEVYDTKSNTDLVVYKENWKYYDGNQVPGNNWTQASFNDNSWKTGNAPLGYGGLGHTTTISYGSNANNKYTTAYFRKKVTITNLSTKDDFEVTVLADDGAVVYVNGQEVGRLNMPPGTISHSTFSTTYNNGAYGTFTVPKNILKEGVNQLAVEVHQVDLKSSDLIMDLKMTCAGASQSNPGEVHTNPVYSGILSSNMTLRAIYEDSGSSMAIIDGKDSDAVLYPTSADEYIIIQDALGEPVRIIDLSGTTVLTTKCSSFKETISLDKLQKGMYIVNVGSKSFKVIKK